jgi:hypothetical protein
MGYYLNFEIELGLFDGTMFCFKDEFFWLKIHYITFISGF